MTSESEYMNILLSMHVFSRKGSEIGQHAFESVQQINFFC